MTVQRQYEEAELANRERSSRVIQLEGELAQVRAEKEQCAQEASGLGARVEALEHECGEQRARAESAEKRAQAAERELGERQRALDECEAQRKRLEEENSALQKRAESGEAEIQSLNEKLEDAEMAFNAKSKGDIQLVCFFSLRLLFYFIPFVFFCM